VSLDALYRTLSDPETRLRGDPLALIDVVHEVERATESRRGIAHLNVARRDWYSIRQDALASCDELRKSSINFPLALLASISTELEDFRKSLNDRPKEYAQINGAALNLRERLDSNEACTFAWDDLVAASKELRYDAFAYVRDTFVSIANLRFHDAGNGGIFNMVRGIIGDISGQISAGQVHTGTKPTISFSNPNEPAGLDSSARLQLAREVWNTATREANRIVWISYRNNKLDPTRPTEIGQVTFYPTPWLQSKLTNNPNDNEIPKEIFAGQFDIPQIIKQIGEEHKVLARVDIGTGPTGPALTTARWTVEAVLDLFGRSGSAWEEAGLVLSCIDGETVEYNRFIPTSDREDWRWRDTDVASRTMEVESGSVPTIEFDAALRDCIRAMRIARESDALDNERVVNLVRGIEVVRNDTGLSRDWGNFIDSFARERWISRAIAQELVTSLELIVHAEDWSDWLDWPDPDVDKTQVSELLRKIRRPASNLARSCTLAVDVYNSFDPNWLPARRLNQALRASSNSNRAKPPKRLLNQLGLTFDRSLLRLRRRRNQATHGGRNQNASSGDVVIFADQMGNLILTSYVHARALGLDAPTELQNKATTAKERIDKIWVGNLRDVCEHWNGA
jgi:hypothetical protein